MNLCEDCNFCCKYPRIGKKFLPHGVEKPAGVLCSYYDNGCTIQETKPRPCTEYKCYWLRLFEAGDVDTTEWRPNEVGFAVSIRKGFMHIDGDRPEKDHPLLHYIREREGDVKFIQRYER